MKTRFPHTATVTSTLQLTIPQALVEKLGLTPGDTVRISVRNDDAFAVHRARRQPGDPATVSARRGRTQKEVARV